jgi:hypothetical protein
MVVRSDQGQTWADVELPCIVRYRANGFVVHFAVAGALLAAAMLCFAMFGSFLAAALLALIAVTSLFFIVVTWWHVRKIDHLRIDNDALTLVAKDGGMLSIAFGPELEFAVVYEQCCRSIVVSTAGDYWNRTHIVADMLDVPHGLSIYGLCDLMNDLSHGRSRKGAQSWSHTSSVRRRQDWYRDPTRISRSVFLAGALAIGALFLCVLFVLTSITWSLNDWIAKPILLVGKVALSLLFTYPAFRFLVVGRLRDIGEPATHQNALGLIWNKATGSPLRLFLRRSQVGRNRFGPEPRI